MSSQSDTSDAGPFEPGWRIGRWDPNLCDIIEQTTKKCAMGRSYWRGLAVYVALLPQNNVESPDRRIPPVEESPR